MKLRRVNIEIFDQPHQMIAEGSEEFKMDVQEVKDAILECNFIADEIEIFYDNTQQIWRWHCNIYKIGNVEKQISLI